MLETLHPTIAARFLTRLVLRRLAFNPAELRDDHGQWTTGGGGETTVEARVESGKALQVAIGSRVDALTGLNQTTSVIAGEFDYGQKTRGLVKEAIVKDLAARTKTSESMSENDVEFLVNRWALTSGDTDSMSIAMQRAVQKEFNLDAATDHLYSPTMQSTDFQQRESQHPETTARERALVRAEYQATQAFLKEHGITEVTLYRGHKGELPEGDHDVTMQPASSWTTSKDIARDFTKGSDSSAIMRTTVKAARILSTAVTGRGCLNEHEVILLGGRIKARTANFAVRSSRTYAVNTEAYKNLAKHDLINIDAILENADWPKRTPDRFQDLNTLTTLAFNPDEPRDDHGRWTSGGGESDFISEPRDAVNSLLNGEKVNIAREDVRNFLYKAARSGGDPNLTDVHVEGMTIFGGKGLNIPRSEMPQIPSMHRGQFINELKAKGIAVRSENVSPHSVFPTQNEISARAVGEKMAKYDTDKHKEFPALLVSKDNFILDGHHHWGLMAALAVETPSLKVPIQRIMVDHGRVLREMHAYDRLHHIAKQDLKAAEFDEAQHPRDDHGKFSDGGSGKGGGKDITYAPHEADAINRYAGSQDDPPGMYVPDGVNGLLRGFSRYDGKTEPYTPAQTHYYRQQIDQLQGTIERTVTTKDQVFYRGVQKDLSDKFVEGTVFRDLGFTSITSDRQIAQERFTGMWDSPNKGRVYEIRVPKGTPLLDVDRVLNSSHDKEYTTEREHLLGHGTRFRVKGDVLEVIR